MYSNPSQTYKMEIFAKIVKGLAINYLIAKSCILDVWQVSEYNSETLNEKTTWVETYLLTF